MLLNLILAVLLVLSVAIWRGAYERYRARRPLIPLDRRRPVPWGGLEVLVIVLLAATMPFLLAQAAEKVTGRPIVKPAVAEKVDKDEKKPETAHPAEQLLRTADPVAIVLVVVMAVIVAPVFEEFFFRVVLQGWLEAVWSRKRRKQRELRAAPWAWMPIVLPATFFAMEHFRSGHAPFEPESLRTLFLVQIAAELLTLGLALAVLRFSAGATVADLGWQPRKLAADAKLAFATLLMVMPPLLLLQNGLLKAIEWSGIKVAPDPIPLFFLALVFGVLYRRTHRMAPSLLMHAAFNAASIAAFFLAGK